MTVPFTGVNPMTKRGRLNMILQAMRNERSSFIPHWKELGEFVRPRRGRFQITDVNRGERRSQRIIDSTGTFSARTLSSGMMSGITSPARQWFKLTHPDPEIADKAAVKEWLHVVTQRMFTVLTRSNFYNSLIELYDDLGLFGTAAMSILEDSERIIHCETFPIGSYMVGVDSKRHVQQFAREFQLSVAEIVRMYGTANPDNPNYEMIDWSCISNAVKEAWDKKQYGQLIPVVYMILPNWGVGGTYDGVSKLSKNKRFQATLFEVATDGEKILSMSGFDEFPVMAPRWEVTGEDSFAAGCPGMTALGDIKQLQLGERMSLKAIEKMIDPPLIGPTALRRSRISTLPSDITYANTREGEQGLRPTYMVNFNLEQHEAKQAQVRARIERAFFADLFLMLSQSEAMDQRANITAREITERHEEKLLALGPVLERLNQDLLDPVIDRVFGIMVRRGMIPEAPPELENEDLKVEYLSIMAQAQKMVGLAGLERLGGYVQQLAQVKPEALDKLDTDELIDQYADMAGVPPQIIVPDEEVTVVRQQRARAQEAAQQAETMRNQAETAQRLAQADTSKKNALTDLLAGLQSPGAVPDQSQALEQAGVQ